MIGGLGFGEMVLIFFVLLLLFGAKRLPELASGIGKGIHDFKRALNGTDETPATRGPAARSAPELSRPHSADPASGDDAPVPPEGEADPPRP